MSLLELLREWALPAPDSVREPGRGTNNTMLIVDIGASTYVVRGHQNFAAEQVLAEHALLRTVSELGLPFAVPTPIPTPDGRTLVADGDRLVTLSSYVPGRHPAFDSHAELALAASALAELDLALAGLPLSLAPTDWRRPFDQIHPAVTDLDELVAELSTALPGSPGVAWLGEHVHATDAEHRTLQDTLQVQIVHGDFAMGNVLIDDGAVTAILDFEIAGIDLRVVDPVAGLMQSSVGWWDGTGGDPEAEAFARGYARRWPLSGAEVAALPVLFRHRALGSAIWRAGRWRRGQASLADVEDRLAYGMRVDSHVAAHDPDWWS